MESRPQKMGVGMEMRGHQTARVAPGHNEAAILAFRLTRILWDTGDFLGGMPDKGEVQLGAG